MSLLATNDEPVEGLIIKDETKAEKVMVKVVIVKKKVLWWPADFIEEKKKRVYRAVHY